MSISNLGFVMFCVWGGGGGRVKIMEGSLGNGYQNSPQKQILEQSLGRILLRPPRENNLGGNVVRPATIHEVQQDYPASSRNAPSNPWLRAVPFDPPL